MGEVGLEPTKLTQRIYSPPPLPLGTFPQTDRLSAARRPYDDRPGGSQPHHSIEICEIAYPHLGSLGAAPGIYRQCAGDVHLFADAGQECLSKRALCRPECDGADGLAIPATQTNPNVSLAYDGGVHDAVA